MRVKHIRADTIFIWSFDLFIKNFEMFWTVLFLIKMFLIQVVMLWRFGKKY